METQTKVLIPDNKLDFTRMMIQELNSQKDLTVHTCESDGLKTVEAVKAYEPDVL